VRSIFFCLVLFVAARVFAAAPTDFKAPTEVAPGVFDVGAVRLDKNAGTVTFPARVNMVDGLVEYLLVSPEGAKHESVLVSEVPPQDVHMAMLLLGAKGMTTAAKAPGRIDAEYLAKAPALTGDRISLTVKWKTAAGEERAVPVERWIVKRVAVPKKPAKEIVATDGPWLYTGSYFYETRFLAQTEGAFVSLVSYPAALINNPRSGSNDDHLWFVNTAAIPPEGTPVEFIIKLEPAAKTPVKK
jgi:hypothetical protein